MASTGNSNYLQNSAVAIGALYWLSVCVYRESRTLPGLLNDPYLLVEIDKFNELFLKHFLLANSLPNEDMLEEVGHVRAQLEVLDETPKRRTA